MQEEGEESENETDDDEVEPEITCHEKLDTALDLASSPVDVAAVSVQFETLHES